MSSTSGKRESADNIVACRNQGPGDIKLRDNRNVTHKVPLGAWVSAVRSISALGDRFSPPEPLPADANIIDGPFLVNDDEVIVWESSDTKRVLARLDQVPDSVARKINDIFAWSNDEKTTESYQVKPSVMVVSWKGTREHAVELLQYFSDSNIAVPSLVEVAENDRLVLSGGMVAGGPVVKELPENILPKLVNRIPEGIRWLVFVPPEIKLKSGCIEEAIDKMVSGVHIGAVVLGNGSKSARMKLPSGYSIVIPREDNGLVIDIQTLRSNRYIMAKRQISNEIRLYDIVLALAQEGWTSEIVKDAVESEHDKRMEHFAIDGKLLKKIDSQIEKIRSKSKRNIWVVVTVHNALSTVHRCLESLAINSPGEEINMNVVIIDDGSSDAVSKHVQAIADKYSWYYIRHKETKGYTLSVNEGIEIALRESIEDNGVDWICLLNSDTWVPNGWLRRLVNAGESDDRIILVGPTSNAAVHATIVPVDGLNPECWQKWLSVVSEHKLPDIPTPTGFCLMIRADTWKEYGPFDVDYYGQAYGEECGYWAKVVADNKRAIACDNAFVWHQGHASYGDARAKVLEQRAVELFLERHGDIARDAIKKFGHDKKEKLDYLKVKAPTVLAGTKPRVCYVVNDWGLYGGVLAIGQIVDRLCRWGWNATIAAGFGVSYDALKALPMIVRPRNFRTHAALLNRITKELVKEPAVIVASVWNTAEIVREICRDKDNLIPAYFVQDDESRFTDNEGNLYTAPQNVYNTYRYISPIIANSRWVKDTVISHGGQDVVLIPVGVDTKMFRPRPEIKTGPMSVMFFYRPETPRRGSRLAEKVIEIIHRERPDVNIATFGGKGNLPSYVQQLGRISQREVALQFAMTDVFVECSEIQGFGLQGLEAMASGCIPVSTPCKGIDTYLVHEHNGIKTEHGTAEELASAVIDILSNKDKRVAMSEAGIRTTKLFDWDVAAWKHAEVYAELLGCDIPEEQVRADKFGEISSLCKQADKFLKEKK